MSDDADQERTEVPTPRRREEARDEGNVARSADLTGAALLIGVLIALYLTGPRLLESWRQTTLIMLGEEELTRAGIDELNQTLVEVGLLVGGALLPLLLSILILAVLVNLGQVGFLFVPKKLSFKTESLDPIKGFGRIFGSSKTYIGLLMNLAKLGLVGAVAWYAFKHELPRIIELAAIEVGPAVDQASWTVFTIGLKIGAVLLMLAIADYGYQRFNHERNLKMTKQQVKEEMKRMEGDPQMKGRRRQIAAQRTARHMQRDVPSADAVVTDPGRLAIAIKYDRQALSGPKVVAAGSGVAATRIGEVASANGVAIVERPALARALYRTVEVGEEITEDSFAAVAEVLAYAHQLDREAAGVG